ncbi:MAG TPA: integration host factor subunit beta [Candidatus Hydrogenedentes bacterium]|nr:integration host factor subunit beta [Candidatus Hydrogenedentota bacterium]
MTKRELVVNVAERLGYTQNEVANIIQAALEAITESLSEGHRIEIRNFGVFEVKVRDARIGRNPRTGQEVPIAEKRVATFKAGKALKEQVEQEMLRPSGSTASMSPTAGTTAAPQPAPQEPPAQGGIEWR